MWSQLRTWLRSTGAHYSPPPPAAPVALHLVANDPGDRGPDLPFGVWPDDPDSIPKWRLDVERKAALKGLDIPGYRTRSELEAAVAACERQLKADQKVTQMIGPALPAHESARHFLKWVRQTNRCHSSARSDGRYTNEALRELYEMYCHAAKVTPSSEAHVRKHLIDLGGVTKGLDNKQTGPRRERPTLWTIKPSLAHVAKASPDQEVSPMAVAA